MRGLGEAYRNVEASTSNDFERLPPGGYVCTIKKVTDHHEAEKPYLEVVYDIREGQYTDYYADEWGEANEWAHSNRHYYTERSMGMFKGFLKAVDESNNTHFEEMAEQDWDEQRLLGKAIGYIIGEEEYEGNDGSVKTRLKVRGARSIQQIRDGRFKQPELKKLATEADPIIPSKPDKPNLEDLPF